MVDQCPDYELLNDVVNVTKHCSLDQKRYKRNQRFPRIHNAEQIEEQITHTEYRDEHGPYHSVEKIVSVQLDDGSIRDLHELLTNVINYWQSYLHSIGVISETRHYSPSHKKPRSRAECKEPRLNFVIVPGVRFKQTICLRRYNYATGEIEPIDLTGAAARMRVFTPRYEVDVFLTNNTTGEEFSRTISLTEDESVTLSGFRTEAKKQAYLSSLPAAQEALQRLAFEAGAIKDLPTDEHGTP